MTKFYLLAAAVISAATPVLAKDTKPADAAPTAASSSSATATARAPSRAQRYCVIETITGSRIPQKTCQTRDDWLREGFDPLAK